MYKICDDLSNGKAQKTLFEISITKDLNGSIVAYIFLSPSARKQKGWQMVCKTGESTLYSSRFFRKKGKKRGAILWRMTRGVDNQVLRVPMKSPLFSFYSILFRVLSASYLCLRSIAENVIVVGVGCAQKKKSTQQTIGLGYGSHGERERKKNKGGQRGQRVAVVFCFRSFYGINECADKAELSKLRGSVLQLRVLFEQDV